MKIQTTIIILLISNILLYFGQFIIAQPNKVYLRGDFPEEFGKWRGVDVQYSESILAELQSDDIVYKVYSNIESFTKITLFLACYNSFDKADFSHSPLVCNTGQGWEIKDQKTIEIPVSFNRLDKIEANRFIQEKLGSSVVTTYWYQSGENVFAIRGLQKIHLLLNRISGKDDKNAFVRLTMNLSNEKQLDDISRELNSFIKDIFPSVINYI